MDDYKLNAASSSCFIEGSFGPARAEMYDLYTQARQTAEFNLANLINQYRSQAPAIGFSQQLFISDALLNANYFNRSEDVDRVLPYIMEQPGLKKFGAVQDVLSDWNGQLHSTSSFEINTCVYKRNGVLVGCQWFAFDRVEPFETFKVVWLDLACIDVGTSPLEGVVKAQLDNSDGKIICEKQPFGGGL